MGKQMLQVDSVSEALRRDGLRGDVTALKMRRRQAWGGGSVCWAAAVLAALLGFNGDELKEKGFVLHTWPKLFRNFQIE